MFSDVKIESFDLCLRLFNCTRYNHMLQWNIFGHVESSHNSRYRIPAKKLHYFIIQGNKKSGRSGISLAARSPSQLIIYSSRFMSFGTNYIQSAKLYNRIM